MWFVRLSYNCVAGRRGEEQRSHLARPQGPRHLRQEHDALGRLPRDQRAVGQLHAQHEVRRPLDRDGTVGVEHKVATPIVVAVLT